MDLGGWDSAITRTEEGGTRAGAAARGLLRVLPWHPIHVEEGGDAAGLHCHQIAPNTCRDTLDLRHGGRGEWGRHDPFAVPRRRVRH